MSAQPDYVLPQEGKIPGTPTPNPGVHWYAPGPVSRAYILDQSFIVGILGPFGSGKSVTTIMKLIVNAKRQVRGADGWQRRRTAIIRNTYPELRTTTMNSFFAWVPKHRGRWREAGPPMLHIVDEKQKLDWEIYFIALDRPDDVAKLLGMELSDAWINEAREVPKAIIDGLTGRVGRYPAMWQGGCTCPQIMMDTNPPDTDHWWYVLAEKDQSTEKNRQLHQSVAEAEEALRTKGVITVTQRLFSFHRQPSGRSPDAENIRNLRPGYYEFLMAGKDQDFIKVYVDGEYGFVMDGLPMFPEYKDSTHSRQLQLIRGLGLRLGFDWGLTPAASISQRTADGRWRVIDELVSERLGITTFANELARKLQEKYPGVKIVSARGDPSGDAMTPEEKTCFQIMRANGFPTAEPAPTNDPTRRREGVAFLLKTIIDGEPGMLVNTSCSYLRKGMAGGYHRRKLQIAGVDRYREVPEKNIYSHVCEALEYDCVSAGEDRMVTVSKEVRHRGHQPAMADMDYDVFNRRD